MSELQHIPWGRTMKFRDYFAAATIKRLDERKLTHAGAIVNFRISHFTRLFLWPDGTRIHMTATKTFCPLRRLRAVRMAQKRRTNTHKDRLRLLFPHQFMKHRPGPLHQSLRDYHLELLWRK